MLTYKINVIETLKESGYNSARACLNIAFPKMCVTVCGRFVPNLRGVVGCVD